MIAPDDPEGNAHPGRKALQASPAGADTPPRMAFADWLLPLLLLTADDEHGRMPFDWSAPALPLATIAPAPLEPVPAV